MSIDASYWRITPATWAELQELARRQPYMRPRVFVERYHRIVQGVRPDLEDPRWFSLEKEWCALQYLLAGGDPDETMLEPPTDPLGRVIMGGELTPFGGPDCPVWVLTPEEVRDAAEALAAHPFDELRARLDPTTLAGVRIHSYPPADQWGEDVWVGLRHRYQDLTNFHAEAAQGGELVLQSLD